MEKKYYRSEDHAFHIYEKRIETSLVRDFTLLDAGCGAMAPVLVKFIDRSSRLIGVDMVDFHPSLANSGIRLLKNDLSHIEVEDGSVDMVISRCVLEHIVDVSNVYKEIHRILKPGGTFLFLVPNLWNYNSVVSCIIPNSLHKFVVEKLTGRPGHDTFPTYYETNTRRAITFFSRDNGFEVLSLEYYGQFPYILGFSKFLSLMGIYYDKLVSRYSCLRLLRWWILCEIRKTSG
jgi:SAM-dependent methyltransferase